MKTIEQIEQELDQKIPRDVVSLRDGGGGRRLSYLEGHYVIDRLNKVFGHLNWAKEVIEVKEVVNKTSKGEFPAYLAKVRLTVRVGSDISVKEGYGYGSDKSTQNAHELAIKEAVTDGLKIAAKDLGMSMGLALYDKTQENVEDEPTREDVNKERNEESRSAESSQIYTVVPVSSTPSPDKLREAINQYFKVGEAQKKITKEEFKQNLKTTYDKEKLAELSVLELEAVLQYLKVITK